MTKPTSTSDQVQETTFEERKEMMRIMAEVSYNPANVIPSKQEELAYFMVRQLR